MSGALGIVAQASGIAGAVGALLPGLTETTVTLGSVVFTGISLPETMTGAGTQRIVRHVPPGGNATISVMGFDYPPISWSGYFEGATAPQRARQCYLMMYAGLPVTLTWLDKSFTVVVKDFTPEDVTVAWVKYRITCEVQYDNQFAGLQQKPSLLQQLLNDINAALAIAEIDDDLITALQNAAMLLSSFDAGTSDALSLISDNAAIIAQLAADQAAQEASINALALEAPANGTPTPGTGGSAASNLSSLVTAAAALAADAAASAFLGRAAKNMASAT